MKKKEIVLPAAALLFSWLFYDQIAGINFLLFSFLIIVLVCFEKPRSIMEPGWWFYCACMIMTSVSIVFINSNLSVFAWIISILVFSNRSFSAGHSTLLNGAFAGYSVVSSPFWMGSEIHSYFNEKYKPAQEQSKRIALSVLVAVAIALLFLFLYMGANPLFNKFIRTMNLNWLNMGWILFTLFGLLIIYGLLYTRAINYFSDLEQTAIGNITDSSQQQSASWPGTSIIATTLFILLNGMLLLINCLDFVSIYLTKHLPEGITLSDFVHDAVSAIIASIVIGVGLIAWFFNGELNFNRYGKIVRTLAYLWMLQNTVIIVNAIVRNFRYVEEYQLTHLRIGVYVFLVLALCGLFLTFRKISHKKSSWWLVTQNVQLWFVLVITPSLFNWDKMVTDYNISRSGPAKPLDKIYLLQLSDANLPELVHLHNNGKMDRTERKLLYKKLLRSYRENRFRQWQSWSLRQSQSNNSLIALEFKK